LRFEQDDTFNDIDAEDQVTDAVGVSSLSRYCCIILMIGQIIEEELWWRRMGLVTFWPIESFWIQSIGIWIFVCCIDFDAKGDRLFVHVTVQV
jgi:hypothetical protein